MSNKTGSSRQAIPLPQGGGAVQGIGESFSPDLFTGTGNFTVPLELPPGRNGFQPQLSLEYSTGAGNGPFGLGWQLSVPGVARKTAAGVPRYRDQASDPADRDTFILSGAEDLVPVGEPEPAVTRFRPRVENAFARIEHVQRGDEDVWRVSSKDGLVSVYGGHVDGQDGPAVVADPADRTKVFAWRLSHTTDPFGNRIEYRHRRDTGSDGPHVWDQLYLEQVRYVDHEQDGDTRFLVSVRLVYEEREGDSFSEYRAGFEVRTRLRCKRIEVRTHPADEDLSVRSYELVYLDELVAAGELPDDRLPPNRVSLLSRIRVVGHDGDRREELPPLDFGYTRFAPERQRFQLLQAVGDALPPRSLSDDDFEMVDLFGKGLPDIVRIDGGAEFWRNLGDGLFDRPREMEEVPAGVRLRDAGVQLADMNGDGRADLLTLPDGYHPLAFRGRWGARVPYSQAPRVEFGERDIRLVDLDGDGVVDALRTADSFELFFNDEREGWQRVERRERRPLAEFPDLTFDDDRVKLADVTGDGLQDFVFVRQGRVDYWPYLGHGRWGRRITMDDSPTFEEAIGEGAEFDPARVLFGDLDGDGLDDLAYVGDDRVVLCINQGGTGWSAPTAITGTPPFTEIDGVRLADMLGAGMAGLLWTFDRLPGQESNFRFLDPTGGLKPYLLEQMDNHMGAITRVQYAPSTKFYLADLGDPDTRWKTPLPFPVQVVERVEVVDEISQGKLTTEYRYRHGYWDGAEREFRGFGMVEELDSETFDRFNAPGLHGPEAGFARVGELQFTPPTCKRSWFHLGPVGDERGEREEPDFSAEYWPGDPPAFERRPALPADALRALRGSVVRTELYARDGSEREDRPYTVTEAQFGIREESPPAAGEPSRLRIFFPHELARRTTQWERGDEPLSRFTFTQDHDEHGQPRRQLEVACPRGWRDPATSRSRDYLTGLTETRYAGRDDERYIVDRVAVETLSEIALGDAGAELTLADLQAAVLDGSAPRRIVAQTVNRYDGGAFAGRPVGEVGEFGALVQTDSLVLTEELVRAAYGSELPPYLSPDGPPAWTEEYPQPFRERLPALAGYVFSPGDGQQARGWFARTVNRRYDFHDPQARGRGLITVTRDPLGRQTATAHDRFGLFPTRLTDATGLSTAAVHDYRAFEPQLVTDANGNRSAFRFTPLALLAQAAVMGKDGEDAGDTPADPGTRLEYELRRRPVSVRTTRRVHHAAGRAPPAERDETTETVEYSDGFGRLVQTRAQVESVRFGNEPFGDAVVPAAQGDPADSEPLVGRPFDGSAVVVSGRLVHDNKGHVVERHEPYFASGRDFSPPTDTQTGPPVRSFHDPRGQVVRSVNADGSEQRVLYGIPPAPDDPARFEPTPWEAFVYDANDNAGRTHPDQARAYAHHWDTPTSTAIDALGRIVATTKRTRAPDEPLAAVEELTTRSTYDLSGRVVSVTDALARTAFDYTHDLEGRPLRVQSLDGGVRRTVLDAAGNEIERRDSRGALTLTSFDVLDRPDRVWARDDGTAAVTLRERLEYGDGGDAAQPPAERAAARAHNRLGRLHEHFDEAGKLTVSAYDFKGNVLEKARQAVADEAILAVFPAADERQPDWRISPFRVDWQPRDGTSPQAHAAAMLDPAVHEVSATYDALNRVMRLRYPSDVAGRRAAARPAYNLGGALERITRDDEVVAERIAANAAGQRTLLALGNGVMTRRAYEPRTARLVRLRSERYTKPDPDAPEYTPVGAPLQDLAYSYDLAGNVLAIIDRTPGSGVKGNPDAQSIADPELRALVAAGDALVRRFSYDPLYRLVSATGRECGGNGQPQPWLDGPRCQQDAPDVSRVYRDRYDYDPANNLVRLRHTQGAGAFTRRLELEAAGNRLGRLEVGQVGLEYAHDAGGNMVAETSSRHFEWDHRDQLKAFRTQAGDAEPSVHAHYLYDAAGERVKKLVRRQGGGVESTTYVSGLFEHHRWQNGSEAGANDRLHEIDDKQRIALERAGPPHPKDRGPAVQYQLGDHLASTSVVVDDTGSFVNREEYSPFGETTMGSFARKRYRFCGKERDEESGLQYHGARYYAPWQARWTSPDPLCAELPSSPYQYTAHNPLNQSDPTGLAPESPDTLAPAAPEGAGQPDEPASPARAPPATDATGREPRPPGEDGPRPPGERRDAGSVSAEPQAEAPIVQARRPGFRRGPGGRGRPRPGDPFMGPRQRRRREEAEKFWRDRAKGAVAREQARYWREWHQREAQRRFNEPPPYVVFAVPQGGFPPGQARRIRDIALRLGQLGRRAAFEVDALGDAAFTPGQRVALLFVPWLRPAFRGNRIDVRVREYARRDRDLRGLTSNYSRGPDFVDPQTGVWFDVTTNRQWRAHTRRIGPGGVQVPSHK